MILKRLLAICFLVILNSCNQKNYVDKIEGKQISISDSLKSDQQIEAFIAPYRENIEKDLDSVIAYSANTYSKSDGDLNTAIGNLMADIVYEQANPIFNTRTGKDIDFVLLNNGGIRSILSKGPVTKRTAYEMMPFENAIVVAELPGAQVMELVEYLRSEKRAHPISRLQIIMDQNEDVVFSGIKGKELDFNKNYFVATNDYLFNGGDHMDFFKKNKNVYVLDYKIRNALIDYFVKVDTLNPKIDDRFIIKNNK
ncbi:5'-nucleotidase, C-terminal domain [Flavobacteriaceae bacterium MAR_2010_188]|nr:5'-nucleotidase, C-terminal domain [Flavobacteriaceae bacterium MAR_2010_188]